MVDVITYINGILRLVIIHFSSVHENHWTRQTFAMARPKCLMIDFTNLNRIYIKPIGQMSDEL